MAHPDLHCRCPKTSLQARCANREPQHRPRFTPILASVLGSWGHPHAADKQVLPHVSALTSSERSGRRRFPERCPEGCCQISFLPNYAEPSGEDVHIGTLPAKEKGGVDGFCILSKRRFPLADEHGFWNFPVLPTCGTASVPQVCHVLYQEDRFD